MFAVELCCLWSLYSISSPVLMHLLVSDVDPYAPSVLSPCSGGPVYIATKGARGSRQPRYCFPEFTELFVFS